MHRFSAFSFAFLLGSVTLAAQGPAPGASQQNKAEMPLVYVVPAPASLGCPVSMHAQHGAGGGVLVTRQSQSESRSQQSRPRQPSQDIHLILGAFKDSIQVVAAKVTVRGTNGKGHAVPATLTPGGAPDETKTLDLRFDTAGNGESAADLMLAGFTSVQSITLDSLTFADGSIWTPSSNSSCRTAPDPFMLISAAR